MVHSTRDQRKSAGGRGFEKASVFMKKAEAAGPTSWLLCRLVDWHCDILLVVSMERPRAPWRHRLAIVQLLKQGQTLPALGCIDILSPEFMFAVTYSEKQYE